MMLENIKMYLRGEGTNPHERQQASEQKRIETTETMLKRLKGIQALGSSPKRSTGGNPWLKCAKMPWPKSGWHTPRCANCCVSWGSALSKQALSSDAEDIFWLEKDEISACVAKLEDNQALDNLSAQVEKRKAFNKKVSAGHAAPHDPD